MNLLNCW